ncbi:hypothetical protein [Helicobacter trogontum]|uniref:hypothetical protein n=1 Tax=Helicobacter trogontum TaxID=50960 RepID=UPI00051E0F6C|nr:hypothetical protein [Helicobacter trogontum]MDY5184337.1 hypothetical protein [Helicobacter trogontum]
MKDKENINENKQKLESKDLESNTNTKEVTLDSKNNTETKNKNSKNNTESIKLDSSGDEIIWELKRLRHSLKSGTFLFLISQRIVMIAFFVFIIYKMHEIDSIGKMLAILVILLVLTYFLSSLYLYFNCKTIIIINNKLIIKKYIGSDLNLLLTEIYCDDEPEIKGFQSIITFRPIINKKILPYYWYLDFHNTNIREIADILKPYIENTLLSLDEGSYNHFKNLDRRFMRLNYLDFNMIDKQRNNDAK